MLQSISTRGRQLNEGDILQFEETLGYKIPKDYIAFLLQYNGGEPVPDNSDVQNTEGTNIGKFIGVRWLFSVGGPEGDFGYLKDDPDIGWLYKNDTPEELTSRINRLYDILDTINVYKGRIPLNLLPIGCDSLDDLICLSLYGEDQGSIWFWDHEAEHYPPSYKNCYKVADSFQDFLDGLFEYDFENNRRVCPCPEILENE